MVDRPVPGMWVCGCVEGGTMLALLCLVVLCGLGVSALGHGVVMSSTSLSSPPAEEAEQNFSEDDGWEFVTLADQVIVT